MPTGGAILAYQLRTLRHANNTGSCPGPFAHTHTNTGGLSIGVHQARTGLALLHAWLRITAYSKAKHTWTQTPNSGASDRTEGIRR